MIKVNSLLIFDVEGKFAHFKKYYSNISSLTYEMPPRTVLSGMIASILGNFPRDSYYDIFSPENCKFSVRLLNPVRKHIECLNYKKTSGISTQVRLEILLPANKTISYRIYFTHKNIDILKQLKQKLLNSDLGYGIYFGQRQFRAFAKFYNEIDKSELRIIKNPKNIPLISLVNKDNIRQLSEVHGMDIVEVSMPCQMKKVKVGREQKSLVNICYERNGLPLFGDFREVLNIKEKENISFYTHLLTNH